MPQRNPIDEIIDRFVDRVGQTSDALVDRVIDGMFPPVATPQQAEPKRPTVKQAKPKVAKPAPKPRAPKAQTLYAILGVDPSCESEIIEAAWKAQCRKWHPDIAGSKGEDWIKAVNAAHDVLCDPVTRREYDRKLREGENGR